MHIQDLKLSPETFFYIIYTYNKLLDNDFKSVVNKDKTIKTKELNCKVRDLNGETSRSPHSRMKDEGYFIIFPH